MREARTTTTHAYAESTQTYCHGSVRIRVGLEQETPGINTVVCCGAFQWGHILLWHEWLYVATRIATRNATYFASLSHTTQTLYHAHNHPPQHQTLPPYNVLKWAYWSQLACRLGPASARYWRWPWHGTEQLNRSVGSVVDGLS